jgi:type I restriction enzyme M protein
MTTDHLQGIEKFEADLWRIADNLRANSNLASNEYFMPNRGLILCGMRPTASMRRRRRSGADKAAGKMPKRSLVKAES